MRSASITYVLVPMLLACASYAAEPAPAKLPSPAVKPAAAKAAPAGEQKKAEVKKGVGILGEVLLRTPSIEATWQNYRGRLALYSVTDRRNEEPLLIGQDAFVIVFADGSMLRSSQMKAGPSAFEVLKPNPAGLSAGERAGGRQVRVALSDEQTTLAAKWACIHRNGSDYLRQTISFSATKELAIADIRLTSVQLENVQEVHAGDASAAASETLFFGVENAGSAATINGAKVHTGIKKPVKLAPGQTLEIATIIGAAAAGQSAEAFKTVLDNEKKAALVVASPKEAKKAAKEEPKKEEPKPVAAKKEELKKEQPKPVAAKKDEPKKEEPKPVVAKKDEPKKVEPKKDEPKKEALHPVKAAPTTAMILDPNATVPAGDTFRAAKVQSNDDAKANAAAAKKKNDAEKARADAAKKKADADAAAAKAKADADAAAVKAKAEAEKAKADAATAKAKADAEKSKAATVKKVEPQPKPVAAPKKAELAPAPKPAASKPAYKFPDDINPNATVPLN